jgi:peptide methionine sulfoxide reductase MsrA
MLGTKDTACDTTHNTVSDRVCKPANTVVGYMGGSGDYPRYDTNYTKLGYSETVRLVYDPSMLSVDSIMKAYFQYSPDPEMAESDPAYKNRIFTTTPSQFIAVNRYLATYAKADNTKLFVDVHDSSTYTFWKVPSCSNYPA